MKIYTKELKPVLQKYGSAYDDSMVSGQERRPSVI